MMLLRDYAEILQGVPFRARIEVDPMGEYAVIQARDLGADGCVKLQSAARLSSLPSVPKGGLLHTGDVLLQPRGVRFPAAVLDAPERDLVVAAAPLWVLRTDRTRIVPGFLVALLMSAATQTTFRQAAVGTHVPQVPRRAIEGLRVDVPNLETQMRLADLARLAWRERELTDRISDARGRLFDLAVLEVAKDARKYAVSSAPNANQSPDYERPLMQHARRRQ